MTYVPLCMNCVHFDRNNREIDRCTAFPDGIPEEITEQKFDHRMAYPGDHDIRFEPIEPKDVPPYPLIVDEDD
jgi:hypothetical protein